MFERMLCQIMSCPIVAVRAVGKCTERCLPRAAAALRRAAYRCFSRVRRQRVQTCIRFISPSIMTRFLWTLGLNWRFVLFLDRGTLWPNRVPLPHILHFAIDLTSSSLIVMQEEVVVL